MKKRFNLQSERVRTHVYKEFYLEEILLVFVVPALFFLVACGMAFYWMLTK